MFGSVLCVNNVDDESHDTDTSRRCDGDVRRAIGKYNKSRCIFDWLPVRRTLNAKPSLLFFAPCLRENRPLLTSRLPSSLCWHPIRIPPRTHLLHPHALTSIHLYPDFVPWASAKALILVRLSQSATPLSNLCHIIPHSHET